MQGIHERTRELLPFAAAGVLEAEEQRAISAHLAECPACRREAVEWEAIVNGLRSLPSQAPAGLAATAVAHVRSRQPVRSVAPAPALICGLLMLSWVLTAGLWYGLSVAGDSLFGGVSWSGVLAASSTTALLQWATAGVAVILLCRRRVKERFQ